MLHSSQEEMCFQKDWQGTFAHIESGKKVLGIIGKNFKESLEREPNNILFSYFMTWETKSEPL